MPPPIHLLPNELTFVVVQLLDIEDAFSLGQTCRRFHDIFRNNAACRLLLEKLAPYSREYKIARAPHAPFTYIRALHTLAKSRRAVTTLQPFAAAVVARDVDVHVYANRTLLYMSGRHLRILDLGRSVVVRREMVVDVPAMLTASLPESKGCIRYKFRPLHYAAGYVTCLYTHQRVRMPREQWLIVFHAATGCVMRRRVTAPHNKVFVRNNAQYLVVGTLTGRSEAGDDDALRSPYDAERYWVLQRFSFRTGTWSEHNIYLDAIGCADFGTDVAFELMDDDDNNDSGGTLYATAMQPRRATWSRQHAYGLASPMSYYCCVRMPLRYPGRYQQATRASRWRRRNDEGAYDDRFCSLTVERDEVTGALTVVEARKEWRNQGGSGGSRRTYYKQEFVFEGDDNVEEATQKSLGETSDELHGMVSIGAEDGEDDEGDDDDDEVMSVDLDMDDDDDDDDDRMDTLDDYDNNNEQVFGYTRAPENVHPGDSTADMAMFSFSDTAAHFYITPCATFVDLVNLPDPETPHLQRMVLRAGSRRPLPPGVGHAGDNHDGERVGENDDNDKDDDPLYPLGAIRRQFQTNPVVTWPPDVDARDSDSGGVKKKDRGDDGQDYAALHAILNPPGYAGHVGAQWDDYTLVCAVGGDGENSVSQPGLVGSATAKKPQKKAALVLVSFDPTLCLPGLTRWTGASERCVESVQLQMQMSAQTQTQTQPTPTPAFKDPLQPSWVSFEAPAYRHCASGFDFSY